MYYPEWVIYLKCASIYCLLTPLQHTNMKLILDSSAECCPNMGSFWNVLLKETDMQGQTMKLAFLCRYSAYPQEENALWNGAHCLFCIGISGQKLWLTVTLLIPQIQFQCSCFLFPKLKPVFKGKKYYDDDQRKIAESGDI